MSGEEPERPSVIVGAGLRWDTIQEFLDSRGLAVVSGRSTAPGVSGLLLGGGFPIVNSLTGLAADNIKSMEIVLSNATVITASHFQNVDLFRALKGGGNNFGIITKFELYTTMPRNIWYRIVTCNVSDAQAVFEALTTVQLNLEEDSRAGIAMSCAARGLTATFVYGEHTNNPAVFAPFIGLAPVSENLAPTNGTALGFMMTQTAPDSEASRDTVGVATTPDADLYTHIYDRFLAMSAAYRNTSALFNMPVQTLGSAATRVAQSNGGNVLGASPRAQTWWNPIAQWTNPAEDSQIHQALLTLAQDIGMLAKEMGSYEKLIFPNIAGKGQKVLASFGFENLNFLREVSHKYDPARVFQRLQNGGFLIDQ